MYWTGNECGGKNGLYGQGASPHIWARTQTELSGDGKESYVHFESYPATPFYPHNTELSHTVFILAQIGLQ